MRKPTMKLPSSNQITILVLLAFLIIGYVFFIKPFFQAVNNTAGGPQAKQGSSLLSYVLNEVSISEKSVWYTNKPPVYVQAFRHTVRLDFFGILDSVRQEQVFDVVRKWQFTNLNMGVVCVRFYEPEKPRGEYGQHIETLQREELIVLTNTQSGVIFNQAAPKN